MPSDKLGTVAPEHNPLLHIEDANPHWQALENVPADVCIIKGRHWLQLSTQDLLQDLSAENHRTSGPEFDAPSHVRRRNPWPSATYGYGTLGGCIARSCYRQDSASVIFSLVSSSGGGLPGRLGL